MRKLVTAHDCTELETRIARLKPDTRALWGRMSAGEMVCHLCDSFRFASGERKVSDASNPFSRTMVKWIALYAPMPWPKNIQTRPEVEQGRGGTPPAQFERDRDELIGLIRSFASFNGAARPPHPIFGRLTFTEWQRWAWLHVDHHLRQFGV